MKAFAKEIAIPTSFIPDPEGTHQGEELRKVANEMNCPLKFLERRTQWANLAELYIGLLKEAVRKDMKDTDSPLKFWDYCAKRRVLINNLTSKDLFLFQGNNPNAKIKHKNKKISQNSLLDFLDLFLNFLDCSKTV